LLLLSSLALYTHRHTGKNFRFHGIFLFFSEKMLSIYQLSCERRNLVFCFDNFCEIVFCFLQRILIFFSCGIMNNQNIGRTYSSSCKKNNSFFFVKLQLCTYFTKNNISNFSNRRVCSVWFFLLFFFWFWFFGFSSGGFFNYGFFLWGWFYFFG